MGPTASSAVHGGLRGVALRSRTCNRGVPDTMTLCMICSAAAVGGVSVRLASGAGRPIKTTQTNCLDMSVNGVGGGGGGGADQKKPGVLKRFNPTLKQLDIFEATKRPEELKRIK